MWVRESCTTPISGLSRRRIWVITSHIFLTNILCHNCLAHNVCTILHSSNIHWMFLTLPVFVFTRACFYLVFFSCTYILYIYHLGESTILHLTHAMFLWTMTADNLSTIIKMPCRIDYQTAVTETSCFSWLIIIDVCWLSLAHQIGREDLYQHWKSWNSSTLCLCITRAARDC